MPDFVLDHEPAGFARIKVIGVGGGGCNAVDSMFDLGLQNVEFYVINSDLQALKRSKCPNRLQIGSEQTKGRGCGASPELGERCMLDAKDEVLDLLQGADIVFITAGLGGGTGTGSAPVLAQIAKELGILTVCVVTKPFKFEGPRRMKSAEWGLARLKDNCDTMIVINNERLLEHVGPKVAMREAFRIADNVLAQAVTSISDLIGTPGLINVDYNDIRTIMGGRGGAVMGVGVGKGENRAGEAVKKATSSPLLDKVVIDGATGVLICITGGADMTLQEVSEATEMVHEAADPDAEIIFGAVIDESLEDQLRVTIIATGFAEDIQQQQMIGSSSASSGARSPLTATRPSLRGTQPLPPSRRELEETLHVTRRPSTQAPEAPAPVGGTAPNGNGNGNGHGAGEEQAAGPQPSSLRDTLEAMMRDQGHGDQPAIRVAGAGRTNGEATNGGTNGGGHPNVRAAGPSAPAAAEKDTPSVKVFQPGQEEKGEEDDADYETPAFLRRRRSLFE